MTHFTGVRAETTTTGVAPAGENAAESGRPSEVSGNTAAEAPQTLCRSCGLCCDGTLFGYVLLEAGDSPAPLQAGGIAIHLQDAEPRFDLPCIAFQHGDCQVYAGRPAVCRTYRCKLLKKYERGVTSWEEAQQQICRVRALRVELGTALEGVVPGTGTIAIVSVMRQIPALAALTGDAELRKGWAPVTLRLSALRDYLRRHFQPDGTSGKPATAG
jgi:Fe-S-cluster containining protein